MVTDLKNAHLLEREGNDQYRSILYVIYKTMDSYLAMSKNQPAEHYTKARLQRMALVL